MARIGLLSLLVNDYDEGIAFFTRCLGFDLIEDSDLGNGKRWVVVGPAGEESMAILLAQPSDDLQSSHVGMQAGGRVAFFLYTDDFAAEHERMVESGVRFLEAPRVESYGTVAVFEDCSGNRWDLVEDKRRPPADGGSPQLHAKPWI
ncbi:MAG TPA: extradiol dioxygenase [Acidimicrobiaceae bacterium]|jgi:predicted enzyme related to lactoylglutathione lyase|nr:extradiol dioxygenase [Acidimicrobiaceae bacterium]